MAVCTLTQSFGQTLPHYNVHREAGGTHVSGSTTLATDPPAFGILTKPDAYIRPGLGYLDKVSRALDREYLSLPEDAMSHLSEGDVARAAAMYLIHPINQALSAIPDFSDRVECLSESTAKGVRSDITFNRVAQGRKSRAFAAVEYKKRSTIIESQFRDALKTVERRASINQHVADAFDEPGKSFFQRSSQKLMKQAGAYAIRHRTQYVALFNWDFLVLIRFPELDPRLSVRTLEGNGVGPYAEVTLIKYTTHGNTMRAALLGFLIQAYLNTPPV